MLCPALVENCPDLAAICEVRALDPARQLDAVVDVIFERGRIARIGPGAAQSLPGADGARIISGRGKWLLPGFVDMHVHFREPGHEYKEDVRTGLAAAAAGGFVHVCAMPNTNPVNDCRAVTEMLLHRASLCLGPSLHPIGAITKGLQGQQLTEMGELKSAGVVAVSDDGVCVQSAAVMRRALEYAKAFDLPVIQHAEDAELVAGGDMHEGRVSANLGLRGRPRVAEDVIVARDVILSEYLGARYHVAHASTEGTVRLVREAKSRGAKVTCEVTPHHLLLTEDSCLGYDTFCKVNPPLREAADIEALVAALADGTIDAIATDHAPHSSLEKDCEFTSAAPGMVGLELCFGLLLGLVQSGKLGLNRLIDALSTKPALIMGIEPPRLSEGALAELVLIDPEQRWTLTRRGSRSKSYNSPFLDQEIEGRVLLTMARGNIVYEIDGGIS